MVKIELIDGLIPQRYIATCAADQYQPTSTSAGRAHAVSARGFDLCSMCVHVNRFA